MRERPQWDSKYELGIEDIDFQHHYFLNLINRLVDDLATSTDLSYRAALFAELGAYARFHFLSEENLMRRAGYPWLQNHRVLHLELLDQLSCRGSKAAAGVLDGATDDLFEFLYDWFFQHTAGEDRLLEAYLKGQPENP
ncbi:MAG: bacteriohemerythrin [Desulfovibrionaceae bacterium]